ncbi:ankyrin repeat domain-containing protein [bacterium]|nr:MAG: ankyrin repeat domain-containing protein [bacterium]
MESVTVYDGAVDATALFRATKAGNLALVRSLIEKHPEWIHARDKESSTPLHWAAWKGHPEIIDLLVSAGADVHSHNENGHWGTTPLHAAAHGNQRAAAEALIRLGADVNLAKTGGGTPLAETKVHNATAVAKLLLAHGARE